MKYEEGGAAATLSRSVYTHLCISIGNVCFFLSQVVLKSEKPKIFCDRGF